MGSFGFESVLYPSFPTDRLFSVAAIVVVAAFLSGLFPAWRVLQLNPSDAMRK
jgi:ABC-type antimicrobial peptide transport system permease subunit